MDRLLRLTEAPLVTSISAPMVCGCAFSYVLSVSGTVELGFSVVAIAPLWTVPTMLSDCEMASGVLKAPAPTEIWPPDGATLTAWAIVAQGCVASRQVLLVSLPPV